MRRICIFCGSNPGNDPVFANRAQAMGEALAKRGLGMVYGGAAVGLMGRTADAALANGAEVIGVLPRALAAKELAHPGLSELHIVDSMHERKALMAKLSDGFIAMPGGIGTFEEICEVYTWSQLGFHDKPCGLLNVNGYYDCFLDMLDNAVTQGFLKQAHRSILYASPTPETLIDAFESYEPPRTNKWIERENQL
ncbi:MAG: TIGR00730 family Rossman fold protein [Oceanidesulfovibrio sp.]